MTYRRRLVAVVALCCRQACQAFSTPRNPLADVLHVESATVHTTAHRVHAGSTFDLTFVLTSHSTAPNALPAGSPQRQYGEDRPPRLPIRLALQPNPDVLISSATVRYTQPDGSVSDPEPLDHGAYRVFRGQAYVQSDGFGRSPAAATTEAWVLVGWARITIVRDGDQLLFEGAFTVEGDTHHVQTAATFRKLRHHNDPEVQDISDDSVVVWRTSDIIPAPSQMEDTAGLPNSSRRDVAATQPQSCGSESLSFNSRLKAQRARDAAVMSPRSTSLRWAWERQIDQTPGTSSRVNLMANIGSTIGCPTARRVALLGIATDCTYTASFDSPEAARSNIITQINLASVAYERTFNISLGIQDLHVSNATCPASPPADAAWNVPCSASASLAERLSLFSAWRGQRQDTNALWLLLSTCNTGPAIGLSWLSQLCVDKAQTGQAEDGTPETTSGTNVIVRTDSEWEVMAHEIGHSFGAVHDCSSSTCPVTAAVQCCPLSRSTCDASGGFIMNPSAGSAITDFSPCTVGNICGDMNLGAVNSTCLVDNTNVATITGSQCGNGIVESGEQCDCGGIDGCGHNPCCDPTTCQYKPGAVCDPANEGCCTGQCGIASAGTVCRARGGVCDPAVTCGGSSSMCPAKTHLPDGSSCGDGLSCVSGQCTSRDMQCRSFIGVTATDNTTYACADTSGCQMCCSSEALLSSGPQILNQVFLPGTTCSDGGLCGPDGLCNAASLTNALDDWIATHKAILVPVALSIAGIFVLALIFCAVTSIRRRRGKSFRRPRTMIDPAMREFSSSTYPGARRGAR